MKKFNFNIILFVFFVVFIVAGIWGTCFTRLKWATIDMLAAIKHGNFSSVFDFKANVDEISNKELSYHGLLMETDSLKNNLLGTRVVLKDDTKVIKANTGSLIEEVRRIEDTELEEVVSAIHKLQLVSEENGAQFLYCAAPRKEYYEVAPSNAENSFKDNYDRFVRLLDKASVPTLDFTELFDEPNKKGEDLFYYTDHHWKTTTGFFAAGAISRELSSRYGFEYNENYLNPENYTIEHFSDYFLGSKGKKVGTYFTWHGADDFDLILPKFETNMTESQPAKEELREGTFEETVLYMQNMVKDYYGKNPYVTYSGGDFRLQIMSNKMNPEGKKVLLVRDSFACVVAPFLSLQTSELHICDVRDYAYYVGEKLNIEEYIREVKPDYVIVLYSGVSRIGGSNGKYDFF